MSGKSILLLVTILFCCSRIAAQAESPTGNDDFDFIISTIKSDYPGYADKYTPELADAENELKAKAVMYPDSCMAYMKQYLKLFKDNHLRISYNYDYWIPIWKDAPSNQPPEQYNVSVPAGLELLNDRNSIEGLWTGYKGALAVFSSGDGKYAGVWLNGRDTSKPVDVSYEFTFAGDTLYASILNHSFPNKQPASLELDGQLLEIHNGREVFVRPSGSEKADKAFLASYTYRYPDPRSLNTQNVHSSIDEETFFIRIPDFDPEEKEDIESALDRHWDEIMSRPNLIVDLRMNGGGQDDVWDKLFSLIYTGPFYTKFVQWYATQGNIGAMERTLKRAAQI